MSNFISQIKRTAVPTTMVIENAEGELVATVAEIQAHHDDSGCGKYRIALVGGAGHGKLAYASDWERLNEMSASVAKLYNETKVA